MLVSGYEVPHGLHSTPLGRKGLSPQPSTTNSMSILLPAAVYLLITTSACSWVQGEHRPSLTLSSRVPASSRRIRSVPPKCRQLKRDKERRPLAARMPAEAGGRGRQLEGPGGEGPQAQLSGPSEAAATLSSGSREAAYGRSAWQLPGEGPGRLPSLASSLPPSFSCWLKTAAVPAATSFLNPGPFPRLWQPRNDSRSTVGGSIDASDAQSASVMSYEKYMDI